MEENLSANLLYVHTGIHKVLSIYMHVKHILLSCKNGNKCKNITITGRKDKSITSLIFCCIKSFEQFKTGESDNDSTPTLFRIRAVITPGEF